MASFNVVGFEDVEKMLLERSEDVKRYAPDMLNADAKVLTGCGGLHPKIAADAIHSAYRAVTSSNVI